jgi:predicted phosphodiesterase
MRVFAISDLHVDYEINARWIVSLSRRDYQDDVLIVAGDVSDSLARLEWALGELAERVRKLLFVPGNHELWVIRERSPKTSVEKFAEVCAIVERSGGSMGIFRAKGLSVIPLLGWYDYSFGQPTRELREVWMDFRACRWPNGLEADQIAKYFVGLNPSPLDLGNETIITFSHFLPRIDVMPSFIPKEKQLWYPVLGQASLDRQIRAWRSTIHVYGHSHVNRHVRFGGIAYVNNALGYPQEITMTSQQLLCVYET